MAILINYRKGTYDNENVYLNVVHYCARCNIYGGYGFSSIDPDVAAREFKMVAKLYDIVDRKLLNQALLSFDSTYEYVSVDTAVTIAYEISAYFADRFQVYYGIHTDTDHLHIHIYWSNVNYLNGEAFKNPDKELKRFRNHAKKILKKHRIELKAYHSK